MRRLPLRVPGLRWLSSAIPVLTSLALLACSRGADRLPDGWAPLALGKGTHCPVMTGRYLYADQPVGYELVGRHVPWDSIPAELDYFEIAGSADTALHLTVGYVDGRQHQQRLVNGTASSGDYRCEDGWLHTRADLLSDRYDAEVTTDGFYPKRRTIRIGRARDGALVALLERTDYDEFAVWCGDGCKGIPLPLTFTTRSTWSKAVPWKAGEPRPNVVASAFMDRRPRRDAERLLDERIAREEALLENGPVVAGQAEAQTRVNAAEVPGLRVRGVSPRDSGWHVTLDFSEPEQFEQFMQRLARSGPVAELRSVPLYRGKLFNGRWTDVVYLRYAQ